MRIDHKIVDCYEIYEIITLGNNNYKKFDKNGRSQIKKNCYTF